MKKKNIALAGLAACAAPLGWAEIVLTDDLGLYGYIDMNAVEEDMPGDSFDFAVSEIELGFNYTTGEISAVSEFSYDGTDVSFETVTITYAASDELSFTAGNILSYLGWEAYDAPNLYQNTYAYRDFSPGYPAYATGASMDYVTDAFSFGVWVGESGGDASVEIAGKYTGVEGLTLFLGYANDPGYETINTWASYETGAFTFAAEYFFWDDEGGVDREGYLAMVNYAVDKFSMTVRYSIEDTDGMAEDWELLTFSPGYAFSDNLFGLLEYSAILDGSPSDYRIAAELIFSF
jgi:hypothetical protein